MHRLPRCSQEDLIYDDLVIPKGVSSNAVNPQTQDVRLLTLASEYRLRSECRPILCIQIPMSMTTLSNFDLRDGLGLSHQIWSGTTSHLRKGREAA